ncbi:uncharacterized protein ACR2FA_011316 [Aphomia sociella]
MSVLYSSLFVFAIFTIGYAERRIVPVSDDVGKIMLEKLNECGKEQGVSAEIMTAVREGNALDTAEYKNILHCFSTKSGYYKSDGLLDIEKTIVLFPENDRETVKKLLEECNKHEGAGAADTELGIYKCFINKSPVTLKF